MTAKELAKIIGVSEATMSLVLNRKPGISDRTRTKVEQKVRELGYGDMIQNRDLHSEKNGGEAEPSAAANSGVIGFVLFEAGGELLGMNSFFPLILSGIEDAVRKENCSLSVIRISKKNVERELHYITDAGCRGYVIFATEMHEEDLEPFRRLGLPFVVFDNEFYDIPGFYTKVNNAQGSYLAIRHLYDKGHRKIGYLSSGLEIDSFKERERSAFVAMTKLGIPFEDQQRFEIGYPHDNAYDGMMEVFASHKKTELPTAFFGDNDLVLVGAMRAMADSGYSIPDDFSLIGFDDRLECTLVNPQLTTIQLPRNRFGGVAIEQLFDEISDPLLEGTTVEINGRLIERQSVADLSTKGVRSED